MFERYSEMSRRVILFARYVASHVGSPEIKPEHLLLGLLRQDKTLARRFLGSPWAAETVWKRIEQVEPIREQIPKGNDIPLNKESKRVLGFAAEEAHLFSDKRVRTHHLLLGILRQEGLATEILSALGVHLASAREDLRQTPHDESSTERFVRERGPLPQDVVELQTHIQAVRARLEEAIASHKFERARLYSDEELNECKKLSLLYCQYGLDDWLFD